MRPVSDSEPTELVTIAEGFIRNSIQNELRTSFGGVEETHVEALPDKKFLIAGWVDVISEDGQVERQNFSCVIYKGTTDSWVGEKIAVVPQQL